MPCRRGRRRGNRRVDSPDLCHQVETTETDPSWHDALVLVATFRSVRLRALYTVPYALLTLLLAAAAVIYGTPFAVLLAIVALGTAYLAYRGSRIGIVCSHEDVTVRNFLQTQSWPWSQIVAFHVEQLRVSLFLRRVLTVDLATGEAVILRDQKATARGDPGRTWIEVTAAQLNNMKARYH